MLKIHQIKNTNWQSNGRAMAELKITYIYNGGYSNNPEFVM